MKIIKIVGWVLLLALIVIQFIPSNLNEEEIIPENQISAVHDVPEDVDRILRVSCYDCHSNRTEYPWYNKIQPVAMYLEEHVEDGKKHLNFDEFATYDAGRRDHKLDEVVEMVEEGEMPLESYTLLHKDAVLSEADAKLLIDWANGLRESM